MGETEIFKFCALLRILALVLIIQLAVPCPILAQIAHTSGSAHSPRTPANLDLSSTQASLTGGHRLSTSTVPVSIQVGATNLPVTSSTLLTPAERVAVYQVLNSGHQSLMIGQLGNAVGGSFNLPARQTANLANLVIPQGVTGTVQAVYGPASATQSLSPASINVNGQANILGALNIATNSFSVTAASLNVGSFGSISNRMAAGNAVLNLISSSTFTNAGSIFSKSDLNISAAGQLTNSGLVQSAAGSVTLSGSSPAFRVDNTGGSIVANSGNINLIASSNAALLTAQGGLWQANNLNFSAPAGQLKLTADYLNGVLNVRAQTMAVDVLKGSITVGRLALGGDPSFSGFSFDDSSFPSGINFPGQPLAIIAQDSIEFDSNIISTANTSGGNGGSIFLEAGNSITTQEIDSFGDANGGAVTIEAPHVNINGNIDSHGVSGSGGAVNISGVLQSATFGASQPPDIIINGNVDTHGGGGSGGAISMTGSSVNVQGMIDSHGSGGTGGSVNLVASGDVTVASGISAFGQAGGGSVNIAGLNSNTLPTSVAITGDVNTRGSALGDTNFTGPAGLVRIAASGPVSIGDVNNNLTANLLASGTPGGSVWLTSSGGDVVVNGKIDASSTGNSLSGGSVYVQAADGMIQISGDVDTSNQLGLSSGGSIYMSSTGPLQVNNLITFSKLAGGNVILVSGSSGVSVAGGLTTADTNNGTLTGGNVLLAAGDTVTVTGAITTGDNGTAGSSSAGNIAVVGQNGVNLGDVDASAGGNGSNIYLSAFGPITTGIVDVSGANGGSVLVTNAFNSSDACAACSAPQVSIVGSSNQLILNGPSSTVLPRAWVSNTATAVSPLDLPGGGFTSINLSKTLQLSPNGNFDFSNLSVPFFVAGSGGGTGSAQFANILATNSATQNFFVIAPTVLSLTASLDSNTAPASLILVSNKVDGGNVGANVNLQINNSITVIGAIDTSANNFNGGQVQLLAGRDVFVGDIKTFAVGGNVFQYNGGSITVDSNVGSITINNIDTHADLSFGGNVNLTTFNGFGGQGNSGTIAVGNIVTDSIIGGSVTIESGQQGGSGNVVTGNISTACINGSSSSQPEVNLISDNGSVTAMNIYANQTIGDFVVITGKTGVTVGNIDASGAVGYLIYNRTNQVVTDLGAFIYLASSQGNIHAGSLNTLVWGQDNTAGGMVSINAPLATTITTGDITTSGSLAGGPVNIAGGNTTQISTGNITTIPVSNGGPTTGSAGGQVAIQGGSITINGSIDTHSTLADDSRGGDVVLLANADATSSIQVNGAITTNGSLSGGTVELMGYAGVSLQSIDTSATNNLGTAVAGKVFVISNGAISTTDQITTNGQRSGGTVILISANGAISLNTNNNSPVAISTTASNTDGTARGGDVIIIGPAGVTGTGTILTGGGSLGGNIAIKGGVDINWSDGNGSSSFDTSVSLATAGSQSGGIYISAYGNINVEDINVAGNSGGGVIMTVADANNACSSCGINFQPFSTPSFAEIITGSGQVTDQNFNNLPAVTILPEDWSPNSAVAITPEMIRGGGFTNLDATGAVTLTSSAAGANFNNLLVPFFAPTGFVHFSTVAGANQELLVVAGFGVDLGNTNPGSLQTSFTSVFVSINSNINVVATTNKGTMLLGLGTNVPGSGLNTITVSADALGAGKLIAFGGGPFSIIGPVNLDLSAAMNANKSTADFYRIETDGQLNISTPGNLVLSGANQSVGVGSGFDILYRGISNIDSHISPARVITISAGGLDFVAPSSGVCCGELSFTGSAATINLSNGLALGNNLLTFNLPFSGLFYYSGNPSNDAAFIFNIGGRFTNTTSSGVTVNLPAYINPQNGTVQAVSPIALINTGDDVNLNNLTATGGAMYLQISSTNASGSSFVSNVTAFGGNGPTQDPDAYILYNGAPGNSLTVRNVSASYVSQGGGFAAIQIDSLNGPIVVSGSINAHDHVFINSGQILFEDGVAFVTTSPSTLGVSIVPDTDPVTSARGPTVVTESFGDIVITVSDTPANNPPTTILIGPPPAGTPAATVTILGKDLNPDPQGHTIYGVVQIRLGANGLFSSEGVITSTSTPATPSTDATILITGTTFTWTNAAGTPGVINPGNGNTVLVGATTSLGLDNNLSQTVTGGAGANTANLAIVTPLLIGTNNGASSTVTLTNGTAQLNSGTSGGTVEVSLLPGGGTSTITINATALNNNPFPSTNTADKNFQIDSSVTLSCSGVITINLASTGTFTASGTLQSTASSPLNSIILTSSGSLNIAGSGGILSPGSANTVLISAPIIIMNSGLNQSLQNGVLLIGPSQILEGNGGSATFAANGGTAFILSNPAATLEIGTTTGSSTLNFNGAPLVTTSLIPAVASPTNITIDANTILSSATSITLTVGGGTFTGNGKVQSTAPGGAVAVTITSSTGLTISGTTGVFDPGAGNIAKISGSTLTFASGSIETLLSGSLLLDATTTLQGNGGTATFNATGGSSFILSNPGASLVIGTATGTSTFSFNGAPVVTSSSNPSVAAPNSVQLNANTVLTSNNPLTISVANNGTITNNGLISSSASASNPDITFTSAGAYTLAGTTGSITPGSSGLAKVGGVTALLAPGLNLTLNNGTLMLGPTGKLEGLGGTSTITASSGSSSFVLSNPGGTLEVGTAVGSSVIQLNGAPVVTTSSNPSVAAPSNLQLDANTKLASNNSVTLTLAGGGTFTNNGTLQSTSTAAALTVDVTSAGALTVNGTTGALDPGSSKIARLSAATLTLGSGLVETLSSGLLVLKGTTKIQGNGGLSHFASTGGSGFVLANNAGTLDVDSASGSSTISFTGAPILTSSAGAGVSLPGTIKIESNTTLSSDQSLTLALASGGTFTNNGTVASTVSGPATTISVTSPDSLTITGNGGSFSPGSGNTISLNAPTSVNVGTGITVTASTGNLTVGTASLTDNGSISSTGGTVTIQSPGGTLTVGGTGSIAAGSSISFNGTSPGAMNISNGAGDALSLTADAGAGNISFNGGTAAVNAANLGQTSGLLTSTASAIKIVTQTGTLTASNMTATNGVLSLTANGTGLVVNNNSLLQSTGDLTAMASNGTAAVQPGATLQSNGNVTVQAATGMTVGVGAGNNVTFTAGQVNSSSSAGQRGASSVLSSNSVTSAGKVYLTTSAGTLQIGNTTATSAGDDILLQGDNVQINSGNNFVALGANILINASSTLSMTSGGSFTSVALYTSNQATLYNNTVPAFTGGGIFLFAGTPMMTVAQEDSLLSSIATTQRHEKTVAGNGSFVQNSNFNNAIAYSGASPNLVGGGYVLLSANVADQNAPAKITLNNAQASNFTTDGGVIYIDPSGSINLSGFVFNAIGPSLGIIPIPPGGVPFPFLPGLPVFPGTAGGGTPVIGFLEPEPFPSLAERVPTDVTNDRYQILFEEQSSGSYDQACALPATLRGVVGMPVSSQVAWAITTDNCQPIYFEGDDGLILFGAPGASFAPQEDRSLLLTKGLIFAVAGESSVVVRSVNGGAAKIPAGSGVIMEQLDNGVKLNSLRGLQINIKSDTNGETETFSAGAGEDIVISDTDAPSGHDSRPHVYKPESGPNQTLLHRLTMCNLDCFPNRLKKRIIKMIKEAQALADTKPNISCQPSAKNVDSLEFTPHSGDGTGLGPAISQATEPTDRQAATYSHNESVQKDPNYGPVAIEWSTSDLISIASRTAPANGMQTLHTGSTIIKAAAFNAILQTPKPGVVNITEGQVLIAAQQKSIVNAGERVIEVEPDTILVVERHKDIVKVSTLWTKRSNAVRVVLDQKHGHVSLGEGQDCIIGTNKQDVMDAVKSDKVACRNIRGFEISSSLHISCSEFSLVSMLENADVLTRMSKSSDPDDKLITNKVIRMAACIQYVARQNAAYIVVGYNPHP